MHLLVLSAFRPNWPTRRPCKTPRSQCTFWCSVLSDFINLTPHELNIQRSQCTFWCSVLSDQRKESQMDFQKASLNAPFGAQCFPTGSSLPIKDSVASGLNAPFGAQCFPTKIRMPLGDADVSSQCTFWCSVLSDSRGAANTPHQREVSMHLLVLSAFRLGPAHATCNRSSLNAPFGAQCFPTTDVLLRRSQYQVSMHLLVLSAFRRDCRVRPVEAGLWVSMHLLVLSAFRPKESIASAVDAIASQCTFWCSVLSDA